MKKANLSLFLISLLALPVILRAQDNVPAQYLDSLVKVLVQERRNWNEASRLLIAAGDPAVNLLLEVLNDKNLEEWPRRKAAFTLADIPSQRIVPACILIFQDTTENRNLRIDVCRALRGKDITAHEKVFLNYVQDEDPFLRLAAMRQVWTLDSEEALEIAFQAVGDGYNLVRRGGYGYLSHRDGYTVDQTFLNGLMDPDWYVREFIFEELLTRADRLSGKLEEISQNPENDESIRWSAVMILRKDSTFQDIEYFFRMLSESDWMIRNEAVLALIHRKDLFTWEKAASRLNDFNDAGKYAIFWIIGRMGELGSVSWLGSKMKDPECGWMAAIGLGLTGLTCAEPFLIEGLKDPDINQKRACLWALNCLGIKDARLFIPFLNHEDPELARLATTGLQQMRMVRLPGKTDAVK